MKLSSKQQYLQLCASGSIQPRLFAQARWLDVICQDGHWDVCLAFDKAGRPIGALPYYQTRTWGWPIIRMPQLTPFLDLWLDYPARTGRPSQRYSFEQKVLAALLAQLPRTAFFSQNYPYQLTNWLPFYWQGFRQRTFYSYRLEDLTDLTAVFDQCKGETRSVIRRAERELKIQETDDLATFYRLNQKSFARRGRKIPYSYAFFQQLDEMLAATQSRKIFLTKDAQGRNNAGLYLVWDQHSAYNLATGFDPVATTPGAVQLLLWHAIREAAGRVNCFDFTGSMIPGVERLFRGFGGVRRPYFNIQKSGHQLFEVLHILWGR